MSGAEYAGADLVSSPQSRYPIASASSKSISALSSTAKVAVVSHEERLEYIFDSLPLETPLIDLKDAIIISQHFRGTSPSSCADATRQNGKNVPESQTRIAASSTSLSAESPRRRQRRLGLSISEVRRMPTYRRKEDSNDAKNSTERTPSAELTSQRRGAENFSFTSPAEMLFRKDGRVVSDWVAAPASHSLSPSANPTALATIGDVCHADFGAAGYSRAAIPNSSAVDRKVISRRDEEAAGRSSSVAVVVVAFHLYAAGPRTAAVMPMLRPPGDVVVAAAQETASKIISTTFDNTDDVQQALEKIQRRLPSSRASSLSPPPRPNAAAVVSLVLDADVTTTTLSADLGNADESAIGTDGAATFSSTAAAHPAKVTSTSVDNGDRMALGAETSPPPQPPNGSSATNAAGPNLNFSKRITITLDADSSDDDAELL